MRSSRPWVDLWKLSSTEVAAEVVVTRMDSARSDDGLVDTATRICPCTLLIFRTEKCDTHYFRCFLTYPIAPVKECIKHISIKRAVAQAV